MNQLSKYAFEEVMNVIEMIFKADTDQIFIHGAILENILNNTSISDESLYVYLPNFTGREILEVIARVPSSNIEIINLTRMISNECNFGKEPNCWKTKYQFANNVSMRIIFYSTLVKEFIFDCDTLMLNKNGFCLLDETSRLCSKSLVILKLIRNIHINECNLVDVTNTNEKISKDNRSLFNLIQEQNSLLKRGKKIIQGLVNITNTTDTCSICYEHFNSDDNVYLYVLNCEHVFCSNCIDKHKCSFFLSHNEDCPICRQKIIFKMVTD